MMHEKKQSTVFLAALAVLVFTGFATCHEASASLAPPVESSLCPQQDREPPHARRLIDAPVEAQQDPCLPYVDRESAGIPAEALAELSAAIQRHLEVDRIVGEEFLIVKGGQILRHETYG